MDIKPVDQSKQYRVWCIINPPNHPVYTSVTGPIQGYQVIEEMAAEQLKRPEIWGNVFGLQVFEDNEWTEWYDEFGNNIDTAFKEQGEN